MVRRGSNLRLGTIFKHEPNRTLASRGRVTATAEASNVTQALQCLAVAVPAVLQSPELVPAAAGFYG